MDMDMGMDNSTTASSMMTSFTTQIGTTNLWFSTWTPTSPAATAGACIGLFLLAILSRIINAVSLSAQHAWSQRAALERITASSSSSPEAEAEAEIEAEGEGEAGDGYKLDSKAPVPVPVPVSSAPNTNPTSTTSPTPLLLHQNQNQHHHHHHHQAPPFVLMIDLPRGLLFAFASFVQYLLMLAVMTFNAWFFVAIVLGLGVGEMGFGRFAAFAAARMGGPGGVH
ncbi:Ctr copper transporter [Meredithblackwellia eburnea MCA 4105]